MSHIFDLCIVADDVRLELDNKASIIGYYGRLPDARIQVARTDLPIYKLVFLFVSAGMVQAGRYGVRLSVIDPAGKELMGPDESVSSDATPGVLNSIISCLPFPLNGAGQYRVCAIVNG